MGARYARARSESRHWLRPASSTLRGVCSLHMGIHIYSVTDFLAGRHCTLDKAVELVKIATRRLAKQQRKWVRKLSSIEGMRVLALRDGEWDAHPELATIPTGKPPPPDIVALGDELLERPLPWEKWAAQVADILESEELQ